MRSHRRYIRVAGAYPAADFDGRLAMETFVSRHMEIEIHTSGKDAELMALLGGAMAAIAGGE